MTWRGRRQSVCWRLTRCGGRSTSRLKGQYQPQAELRTGRLTGLEALVRWHDPARGQLPTSELIRLAEDTGLIAEITDYVCREAFSQFKAWQDRGLSAGMTLGINISGAEVRDNALVPLLRQRAAEAGVSLSALEIEITESALMQSDATATDVLSELRDDGVRVSVDGFGTGYSSLARLQLLPVDVLKIDQASSIASGVRRRRARWSERSSPSRTPLS